MALFAKSAYGMQLWVGGTAPADPFKRVQGLQEINPPDELNFGTKEIAEHKIEGDPGFGFTDKLAIPITTLDTITFTLTWLEADPGQNAVKATQADTRDSVPHYFKVLRRNGTGYLFAGYCVKWKQKTGIKDEIMVEGAIEIVGGADEV